MNPVARLKPHAAWRLTAPGRVRLLFVPFRPGWTVGTIHPARTTTHNHPLLVAIPMGKLVGIDLGTSFSAIATLDDHGQPVTLPNRDGDMLTPSAVLIENGGAVVGQAALDVALEQDRKST